MASEEQATVTLRAATLTDVGVVREHNEDSAHVDPLRQFFIVADGMGGHAAGEVASAMAVQTVRETLEEARSHIEEFAGDPDENGRKELVTLLETAVRAAHRAVFERGSRETDKQGMGTTLEVVLVAGSEAFVAHVGDSRTYLVREGAAAQITTDHTVAEVLVLEGKLSAEEAQMSPLRTILVNAIGVAPDVGIEMAHVQLRRGDQILLCSDGLHDYFPAEQELADRLSQREPDDCLAELVELAKERGGHDNITGIVVNVLDGEEAGEAESAAAAAHSIPEKVEEEPLSDGIPAAVEEPSLADTLPVDQDRPFPGLRSVSVEDEDEDEDGDGDGDEDEGDDAAANAKDHGKDGAAAKKKKKTKKKAASASDDDDDDDEAFRTTQPIEIVKPSSDGGDKPS
ncbi:PP2C family protein-serine/threonine phosphatase [Haliangium sp.]|uniref:PP2C family protein-serine/threonine phosphatase n=1 Tax=Haliangium sp. TaxID=2663208 RepID=UPI003D0D5EAC